MFLHSQIVSLTKISLNTSRMNLAFICEFCRNPSPTDLKSIESFFQSLSPGFVWTEGVDELLSGGAGDTSFLETEDIADAVLYILSTPERVNVSTFIACSYIENSD